MAKAKYETLDEFPGYRFGDDGTFWSCRDYYRGGRSRKRTGPMFLSSWHRIATTDAGENLLRINLRNTANRQSTRIAARLILLAFVGAPPVPGMIVRYNNGDYRDIRLSNLRWADKSESSNPVRGTDHPRWTGDDVSKNGGHKRAGKLYVLGACVRCGKPATDRHHVNGNTADNRPENVMILCRSCHMALDGRAEKLAENSRARHRPLPPKPCLKCTRLYKPLRRGLCSACYERERTGKNEDG